MCDLGAAKECYWPVFLRDACACVCSSSSGTISEMAEGGLEIRCCEISMMMLEMMISMIDELVKYRRC